MKVLNVMHRGAASCAPNSTLPEIAKIMQEADVGVVPVVQNGEVIGMVTDRDIATRAVARSLHPDTTYAQDIMTGDPARCREEDSLDEAIQTMERRGVRRLPVLDDSDQLVGMLSLGDVAEAAHADVCGKLLKALAAHHESIAADD